MPNSPKLDASMNIPNLRGLLVPHTAIALIPAQGRSDSFTRSFQSKRSAVTCRSTASDAPLALDSKPHAGFQAAHF